MKKLLALLLLLPSLALSQTHTAGMLDLSQVWTATNTFNFLSSQAGYITVATGTFTGVGNTTFSITTSSGISVPNTAGVYAGFFSGNGSALTNISATSANTVPASGVLPGTLSAGVLEPVSNIDLSTVTTAIGLKVSKAGDTMTGTLNMTNVPIVQTGPNGYITNASSVNASAFFGSGINITGTYSKSGVAGTTLSCAPSETVVNTILAGGIITGGICGSSGGSGGSAISWMTDDFTAITNGVTKDFTLSSTVANSSSVFVLRNGLHQRPGVDYEFTPPTSLHMIVAPAPGAGSAFFATYTVNLASGPLAVVTNATQTLSGINTFTQQVKLASGAFAGAVLASAGTDGASYWTAPTGLPGLGILAATQTWTGVDTYSQAPVFSSGAAVNYFAMSDGIGTLNWVPGTTVRANIAADPILVGIRVGSADNTACTSVNGVCFLDGNVGYYNIAPYIVTTSSPTRARMITESDATILAFTASTGRNLACQMGALISNAGTATFTVRKNGADTSITCSVTAANGASCSDSTHTVSFAAGDKMSLYSTTTGGAAVSNGSCYFQLAF